MAIQQKISRQKLRAKIGKSFTAMLEGPSADTEFVWQARLEGMAPEIDGKIYVTDVCGINDASQLPPPGTMARIEITEAQDYDLIGRATEIVSAGAASLRAAAPEPAAPFPILA
jgi:tRNA A37 methylthiotransferase MiaB